MSLIFNKAREVYKPYQLVAFLVTAVHVAIILFGLFSFSARSERGAQIMMMASLIDHSSTDTSIKTLTKVSRPISTTHSEMSEDRLEEKRSDAGAQNKKVETDQAGSAPVTMPNPFAKGLDNPKPPYPLMSRRLNEEGKVVLNVCVSLTGLVEKLKLEKTSGYQRLDDIALETVKKWKFIPAKNHDRDINACYLLPVQFILRKDRSKLNS
jgi:TonB family protein